MLQLASRLSRLALAPKVNLGIYETFPKTNFHTTSMISFNLTDTNFSAMSKKKKRTDPGQLKMRDEKRKRRLAKALKKMEKKDRQPKPLIECEVPMSLHKESLERTRGIVLAEEIQEERIYLQKDWSRFAHIRHHNELWKQDRILLTQQMALEELRKESEALYQNAIQFDPDIMPISFKGPVATPPIKDYLQDGEYKETTQTFKVIYEDTEEFMKSLLMRKRQRKKTTEEDD
eukprot:GFUD01002414.1.p1 GENE.GFUD01002414.1~~GFUD01002414.1.p1  ORF type:complete len:232 (-),score=65.79 GFUD01002414.1:155-850(-)